MNNKNKTQEISWNIKIKDTYKKFKNKHIKKIKKY